MNHEMNSCLNSGSINVNIFLVIVEFLSLKLLKALDCRDPQEINSLAGSIAVAVYVLSVASYILYIFIVICLVSI